jgi:hypothetical protein
MSERADLGNHDNYIDSERPGLRNHVNCMDSERPSLQNHVNRTDSERLGLLETCKSHKLWEARPPESIKWQARRGESCTLQEFWEARPPESYTLHGFRKVRMIRSRLYCKVSERPGLRNHANYMVCELPRRFIKINTKGARTILTTSTSAAECCF